ncbi:hypothetical protein MTO96_049388 [Rhipicephalus appendiculatus]
MLNEAEFIVYAERKRALERLLTVPRGAPRACADGGKNAATCNDARLLRCALTRWHPDRTAAAIKGLRESAFELFNYFSVHNKGLKLDVCTR